MPPIQTVRVNGPALRAVRQLVGLSISQLAREARVAMSALSYYEREIKQPSMRILIQISRALGVPVAALVRDDIADLPNPIRTSKAA